MHGICSPSALPRFTLLPVTSVARRKYEMVLAKRADLPLERCPTTSLHPSTATVYLSYSFPGSSRALRIFQFLGVHLVM